MAKIETREKELKSNIRKALDAKSEEILRLLTMWDKMNAEEKEERYDLAAEITTEEIFNALRSIWMSQTGSRPRSRAATPDVGKPKSRIGTPESMPDLLDEEGPTITIKGRFRSPLDLEDSSEDEDESEEIGAPYWKIMKVNAHAKLPTRATTRSAGLDIALTEPLIIGAGKGITVGLGLAIQSPPGYRGNLSIRSGVASRFQLQVLADVIDEDYRGEIRAVFFNHSNMDLHFGTGDKLVQLEMVKAYYPKVREVTRLDMTARGNRGFGSTGLNPKMTQNASTSPGVRSQTYQRISTCSYPECPIHSYMAEIISLGTPVSPNLKV